ncbi:S-methyl-5-thioribose-1-phosphate isomerase [Rhodopirellula halodulae]|uniref:S-methyl-5-thioribose-1-phosphate isomerase n=1 Tax=Rhodopirellula halodulae TaxID=2894198 RepID=UPI001E63576C|nr:S-methyl-5-thioribose-1-phosphate isomerase [Rhodopirellula sp. JC737]MCC9654217.1 S-methyl-5-thioribose-1-phosphate isomerase [Rhodopirellula sp. JC737]
MNDAETIRYHAARDGRPAELDLLDQTKLPGTLTRLVCTDIDQTHDAIRRLVVRGAPAIGIAAAYGVTLTPVDLSPSADLTEAKNRYRQSIDHLATSRPTAVNLFWALDRMRALVDQSVGSVTDLRDQLVTEAIRVHDEDRQMCRSIGANGAPLLASCRRVMTHCNAGSLATSMWGTALAPMYHLHEAGQTLEVFADETRPLLQGARLTAWELHQAGIPVTVCTDSMAGSLMREGKVDAVIVGADRIAANGDVANKIGTYPLAVLARYHKIPFYVAAPTNTFDAELDSGDGIPIEQRSADEVSYPCGTNAPRQTPEGVPVVNPAFDVTPAELVTALVTEKGVISAPNTEKVLSHLRA